VLQGSFLWNTGSFKYIKDLRIKQARGGATHCNTLQTLQHICNTSATHASGAGAGFPLQHTASHCNNMQHTATHLLIKHARGAGARFHLLKSSSTKIATPTNARRNIQNTFCTLRVFECE